MKTVRRLLAGLLLLGMVCTPSWGEESAEAMTELLIRVEYGQTEAREMLSLINELRMGDEAWYWDRNDAEKVFIPEEDRHPLVYDCELEKAAMRWAAEIALCFTHQRPNGQSCFSAQPAGLVGASGENIAACYGYSAEQVFRMWREDEKGYDGQGHRRNMLNPSFNRIGIGHVVYDGCDYWVQELGYMVAETEKTEPRDAEELVTVEVKTSLLSDYAFTSSSYLIEVREEKLAELSGISMKVAVEGHWPSNRKALAQNENEYLIEDEAVARLEKADGYFVRGVSAGQTRLTVRCLGQTMTIPVKVRERVRISLSAYDVALRVGESAVPVVEVNNGDGAGYRAQSSDTTVVSVKDGVLQARAVGSAVITYTAVADKTETCELRLVVVDENECAVLPAGTRRLETEALDGTATVRVELPDGMEEIAENALAGGSGLRTVAVYGDDLAVTEKMLGNSVNVTILCAPDSIAETYAKENGMNYLLLK